jgi:hypothetical protein
VVVAVSKVRNLKEVVVVQFHGILLEEVEGANAPVVP